MWPTPTCMEFTVTVAVVGTPRLVVAQRVMLAELAQVERADGAVWSPPLQRSDQAERRPPVSGEPRQSPVPTPV